MVVRKTKNTMCDIKKLRKIHENSRNAISLMNERIYLLQKFLYKLIRRNIFFKLITLFLYSYRKESIKLCRHEIEEEKKKILDLSLKFEESTSPSKSSIDKLKTSLNQLRKMKVFYRLDSSHYKKDQIDLNEFEKHSFSFYKKDEKIYLEDDLLYFEINSFFIGMYDDTKNNLLLEMFSYDNVLINSKIVYFYSKVKKPGMKIKLETWLYHNEDGSKDESVLENAPIYVYALKMTKITFKLSNSIKEYLFIGNDIDKMTFFHNLLEEYLLNLKHTFYEVSKAKEFVVLSFPKLLEQFKNNKDYAIVIFEMLLENKELKTINISSIYKKYNLCYQDLIDIIKILKKYGVVDVSLGMELIPKLKIDDVDNLYQLYLHTYKETLFQGDANG